MTNNMNVPIEDITACPTCLMQISITEVFQETPDGGTCSEKCYLDYCNDSEKDNEL